MYKGKEWLEKQINKTLNIDGGSGERIEGFNKGLEFSLDLIEELDEPELPVIPQFVADWIKECKARKHNLFGVYQFSPELVSVWIFENQSKKERVDLIARAWLDGYTIEKEKMYRVKFAKATKNGDEMYLEKNDGEDAISIDWSSKDFVENEDPNDYLFTEQEIKAIDERYWAFAEEVTE